MDSLADSTNMVSWLLHCVNSLNWMQIVGDGRRKKMWDAQYTNGMVKGGMDINIKGLDKCME